MVLQSIFALGLYCMYTSNFNQNIHISYCAYAQNFMNVRVQQPIDAMRQLGANVRLVPRALKLIANVPDDEPKILILQRAFLSKEGWPLAVQDSIKKGWVFIVEYDDYPENPFNAQKRANSLDWVRFKMCHAVQTSTQPLAEAFKEHNTEVGLFENQLYAMPEPVVKDANNIRVFFGALNRKDAWEPLIESYNRVLMANPKLKPVVLHDKEFYDALETENKEFRPAREYDQYLRILHSCDICLQPLDDTKFNRHKSDIKFVEAGAGGLAVIASPVVYNNTILHEQTGLIAETPDEWENAFTRLARDAVLRKYLGENAKNYVLRERMLVQHAHKRLDWYKHIWAHKSEINARLFADFPQLRP